MSRFRFNSRLFLSWLFSFVLTLILYFLFITYYIGFNHKYAFIISFSTYFLIYLFWINVNHNPWRYYLISTLFWFLIAAFALFVNPELTCVYLFPIIASITLAFGLVVAQKNSKMVSRNIIFLSSIGLICTYTFYLYPKFVFNKSNAKSKLVEKEVTLFTFKENNNIFLLDLNGDTVRFKDFSAKVNYFELWFLSCRPCLQKMPSINQLKTTFSKNSNVHFTSIIDGNFDSFEQFRISADKYKSNFNTYLYAPKESMKLIGELINVKSYPYELIYYKDSLHASHLGFSLTEHSYYVYDRTKIIKDLLNL